MDKIKEAQSHIEGLEVAEMGIQFALEFRGTYPDHILANMMTVGPMQSFIGLAIKNGHLVPGPGVAELREQLAIARADGEWLAHWIHVHSNHVPKAEDAHRIGDIANRLVSK